MDDVQKHNNCKPRILRYIDFHDDFLYTILQSCVHLV
jgi:hypothetical protein